jgi:hypothetical protein
MGPEEIGNLNGYLLITLHGNPERMALRIEFFRERVLNIGAPRHDFLIISLTQLECSLRKM